MELRTTRETRHSERLSKPAPRQERAAPASPQPSQKRERADKLSVSARAAAWLEEQSRSMWESAQERERKKHSWLEEGLGGPDPDRKETDILARQLDALEKCQKIAASIMKGNRVPLKDLQYLMDNDPDGYMLAMALRRQNPDPEDEKSVLDEEGKNRDAGETGGGEVPRAEAAQPLGE